MKKNLVKTEIDVNNNKVGIMKVGDVDYISLTDLARYAEKADVLNVALFGMTAKEWREENPKLAKEGNIRDYTDLLHLVILNNLENSNAEFIKLGLNQGERLVKLNDSARNQMNILKNNNGIKELEILQQQINDNKYLIENK